MHASRFHRNWLLLLAGFVFAAAVVSTPDLQAADAGHAAEDGDHGGHDEPPTGVPMPTKAKDIVPYFVNDLALWTVVTFVLFLVVLKKVAWGPLIEGLDNRESKYRKLLADAEADREKAVSMLADYEEKLKAAQGQVDEIIAEARRDAERTKTDILATAQQDAEATRKRAIDDIGRARDQAVAELFDHVRANVVSATEKVLSRSLTDADEQKLIDDALSEMSSAQG
ncbi:MAG: F0F1 ATP synthase subunit B [Planctomycetaceae bacterium]|nr:F0F1 ATP synthase subunit B [Planctomycetaceae bacterium]